MHTAGYWVAWTLQSGGAGHLPANARDQLPHLLNCQGRRLGLRESRGLSKDKGHLSCHPKKGRKSVSMTRESWQARSCHWHTRGQRPGFPAPSGFPHCGPSTHTHTPSPWVGYSMLRPVSSHLISKQSCSALRIKAVGLRNGCAQGHSPQGHRGH